MSNILKARTVMVDNDNYFSIQIDPIETIQELPALAARESVSPEEKAQSIIIQAKREAEQIMAKARGEADWILTSAQAQAQEEADVVKEQARADGFSEGRQQALAEGEKIKAQANAILADAHKERKAMETSLEPDMVALIADITHKLISDTARLYPGTILTLIRQGFAGASLSGDIWVHVSPHDFDALTERRAELSALADSSVKLDIIRDPSLNKMDCVIETPFGNIDCSLTQQYESLRDQLTYILQTDREND